MNKTLVEEGNVFSSVLFTENELEKFRNDKTRNPRTGRKISPKGKIYKILVRQLETKDNLNERKEKYQNNELEETKGSSENIPPKIIVKKLKDKPLKC